MISTVLSGKYLRWFFFGLAALAVLAFSYFRVFELYELQTYDWRFKLRGPRPVNSDIVFIDIFDDTIEKLGQWPLDRDYHAELIKALKKYGAKAVLFDMVFTDAREHDDAVVKAAAFSKNVYFVTAFANPVFNGKEFEADQQAAPLLPSYAQAAKSVACVNVVADTDGKRRRIPPAILYKGKRVFHLAVKAALDLLGAREEEVKIEHGHLKIKKDLVAPLDGEGCLLVNYAGKWADKAFEHYSYVNVLQAYAQELGGEKPLINLKEFKNKICFVGFTATATVDTNANPLEPIYPNVGIHANALNTILERDFIRRAGKPFNLLLVMILSGWVLVTSMRYKPLFALRATFLMLALFITVALCSFLQWGYWIDLFYPCVMTLVVFSVAVIGRTIYEIRKREVIENELKIASQIQQSFLPASLPQQKGMSLALYMKPAKAVGGDLYTFIPLKDDKIGVMIGDVSGKGTPAALFMAKVVSEFKFSARDRTDPAQVLTSLNDSIAAESTGGLFVTLSYVIFDVRSRKLFLSNGGHLPLVVSGAGGPELLNAEGGMPVGVMEGVSFSDLEHPVRPGDCFAFYTDGVSEARNRKKEEYGIETLQKMISDNRHLSAQGILDQTVRSLNQFMGKADQHDDITLIVVKIEETLS